MNNYTFYKDYLRMCRNAFYSTAQGLKVRIYWNSPLLDAAGWKAEFMEALDKRITCKGKQLTGRKLSAQYQAELRRDCWNIRDRVTRRIRFYQIATPELQKRFGHLLARHDD